LIIAGINIFFKKTKDTEFILHISLIIHYAENCMEQLRHYATSRKVTGSRPDEMNAFFPRYLILPGALGPGVYSKSNRSEY
jgi:hypothetical protein